MPMSKTVLKAALLASSLAVLGGCVSVLPEPVVPAALITLPASRAKAPEAPLNADVNIFPPDATRAWAGSDIPVTDQQEMVFLSDVRWADTAPRILQNAVVDALSGATGPGRAFTAQQATRSDYDLRWRIVDMSVGKGALPVHVKVDATLVDSRGRRVVSQKSFAAEAVPAGATQRDRGAALAVAAQTVADQVAAFVAVEAKEKPDPLSDARDARKPN